MEYKVNGGLEVNRNGEDYVNMRHLEEIRLVVEGIESGASNASKLDGDIAFSTSKASGATHDS